MEPLRSAGLILVGTALLSGCSSLPASPSDAGDVEISPTHSAQPCASLPDTLSLELFIANRGSGTFRTYLSTVPGRPYKLSWLSYSVAMASPSDMEILWEHGAGGHGPLPQNELAIGPNDGTRVVAKIYGTSRMDTAATYRIVVEDLQDQTYVSDPFTLCQP